MEPQFTDNPHNPLDRGDPRTPLERMRRKQLYAYADAFDVSYPTDCSAETLRNILAGAGITGQPPPEVPVKAFEDMTMPELRKACKEYGLPQKPTDKAADLIARLNGNG